MKVTCDLHCQIIHLSRRTDMKRATLKGSTKRPMKRSLIAKQRNNTILEWYCIEMTLPKVRLGWQRFPHMQSPKRKHCMGAKINNEWSFAPLEATTTTTATKTPQICIFGNGKQYFCALWTCIFHLLTFWRRSRSSYDMKWPVVWTTWAYDDKCSILSSYVPSAVSNLIPG